MLKSPIVLVVKLATDLAWLIVVAAIIFAGYCGVYAERHFAVATDVRKLFPTNLPWSERAVQFMTRFPIAMRFACDRSPLLENMENNSYGIYLLH
jgi:hypothetical protein